MQQPYKAKLGEHNIFIVQYDIQSCITAAHLCLSTKCPINEETVS